MVQACQFVIFDRMLQELVPKTRRRWKNQSALSASRSFFQSQFVAQRLNSIRFQLLHVVRLPHPIGVLLNLWVLLINGRDGYRNRARVLELISKIRLMCRRLVRYIGATIQVTFVVNWIKCIDTNQKNKTSIVYQRMQTYPYVLDGGWSIFALSQGHSTMNRINEEIAVQCTSPIADDIHWDRCNWTAVMWPLYTSNISSYEFVLEMF